MEKGRIFKALSGYYYVRTENNRVYECKGRGVFRQKNITPLVGDFVVFTSDKCEEGYITEIKQRKNQLKRPPIANVDQAIIVTSVSMPQFNQMLLDRFLVSIEAKEIKPIIFITKMDLLSPKNREKIYDIKQVYEQIGYDVELISTKTKEDLSRLKKYFSHKVSVVAGQSGVGKSSLLNALNASLLMATDDVSLSLGRGKHTTRHVELVEVYDGLVADTPGFSSLEFTGIGEEELEDLFPEIRRIKNQCRFRSCRHDQEPQCAVKNAVTNGHIHKQRFTHYLNFLEEIKSRKPRYS